MAKENVLAGMGLGSTITSFMTAAMPYLQFIAICLGIVATGLAIYLHIRKLKDGNSNNS